MCKLRKILFLVIYFQSSNKINKISFVDLDLKLDSLSTAELLLKVTNTLVVEAFYPFVSTNTF